MTDNNNHHQEAAGVATVSTTDDTWEELVPLSKERKLVAADNAMQQIPDEYSSVILSESWKTWEEDTIQAFVLEFHVFFNSVNNLRSKLDKSIWQGKSDGTVHPELESIRDEPDASNKRGRKAVELSPAERALKNLGKL